jgi:multidrug efflux pump subunit AcrB
MKVKHVESVYTTVAGGSAGTDPLPRRRGGSAQGDADHPAVGARRAAAQAGHREPDPHRAGTAARRAHQGRPRGSGEKYILVLTGEDPQALDRRRWRWRRTCGPSRAWARIASTASLIRPEIAVRPDFARAADLGVTSQSIADTLRIATAGRLRRGAAQAEPVAAAGADRREAERGRRGATSACWSA